MAGARCDLARSPARALVRALPRAALCFAPCVALACAGTAGLPIRDQAGAQEELPAPGDLARHGRQVNFGIGARAYEDEDLGPLDEPLNLALDYCEPLGLGALRFEGGLHYADEDSSGTFQGQDLRLDLDVFELSVGFHYSLLLGRVRPYVGAGGALQFLDVHGVDREGLTEFQDEATAAGVYLKGGLLLQVTPTSHLGLEFRHLEGDEVRLDGTALDTSYDLVMLVFGTSFWTVGP